MGGGAALTWRGVVEQRAVAEQAADESARIAAMTAAERRTARGGTDGFQEPVVSQPPTRSTAVPMRVLIPELGVDSSLERLHQDARGVLVAPEYADQAGWWAKGVVPGDTGAAVIVGHLDTILGPAVFEHLKQLRPGDLIEVRMSDGRTLRFAVDGSHVVKKALFPSDQVYGPTPDAQLRLITCSEPFDPVAHSYTDNLVVFATLKS
ncbi:class F sortase [Amnibacterium kyonggiense]|uniref:Sortase (Surface protein transpeptidase) n=1 Tax=Amnibacterium kyonggiense TaxID=595671 RepID=A0A4V3EBA4_9MICO|nr:class F sortase [Amnibacterium kyonggiense]TDS81024.1 sortase (surface protein transpeptidase) [Amnibacterium kyonggiense]